MILPLTKRNAEVVKERVTGTLALPAMRSACAMVKETAVGPATPIPPEATPADAAVSESVCTVMPVALPGVAINIVKPLRVMVKGVDAAMPETAVVMTMELPAMTDVAVIIATDVVPAALLNGFGVAAKNPAG